MYLMALVHLFTAVPAIASDITNADYYGTVVVVNNSTANTTISSNITNMSVTSLVNGGFIPSAANTTLAMRTTSGADIAFQPGYTTSTWMTWVPSIPEDGILNYIFYTGNITGGKVRYFPGSTGMTTNDDPLIELGANFTIEQAGYIDTSAGADKYLVYKLGAFTIKVTNTEEITAAFDKDGSVWTTPTSDTPNGWTNPANAYDDNIATFANHNMGANIWSPYLELEHGAIATNSVRFWVGTSSGAWNAFDLDAFYDGIWNDVSDDVPAAGVWVSVALADTESVSSFRMRFRSTAASIHNVYELDYGLYPIVVATGISSGEHKIVVISDGTDFKLYVDDVEEDSIAIGASSVPNTAGNWTCLDNDVMPYMEYHRITVGGNLRQYIAWEYDTTFTDLSGNSNDATPSFAVDSSDSDITASLTTYQPITEAQAPAYSISDAPDFITTAPNLTSNFSSTIAPTIPGADVITDVAASSSTPAQLPWVMIAGFVILVASISSTYVLRKFGATASVFIKLAIIACLMGASVSVGVFDFWMVLYFLLPAIAIGLASRPQETLG